jgi:hypothetical protein
MDDPLQTLAARAEREPFFLASLLAAYARSEGLDDTGLANALGCRKEDLVMVRLCRAPRAESPEFWEDVQCVAGRFGLDLQRLAEAVKRGQVIVRLQTTQAAGGGRLMAARDPESEPPPEAP